MIVKSMSRKIPSFGQLIGYIDRDEGQEAYRIRHNLLGRGQGRVRSEFERNSDLLAKRKNGVYLYHEIISITRAGGLSAKAHKERLHDIAQAYIAARCPDNLVYGGLHQDKEHSYHYHLMISANRAGEVRRLRLAKAQFRQIQVGLEVHVLAKYPELEQKIAIGKRSEKSISRQGAELERRSGARPQRQEMLDRVRDAFEKAKDRASFMRQLDRAGLDLYVRGQTLGVVERETGKRHRFKTLDADLSGRVNDLMRDDGQVQEKTGPAGEKEKQPEHEARARGAAEHAPQPKSEPEQKPQERAGPAKAGSAEREALERSERQKAWREEIDRQRSQGRDGPGHERE
jgi:hypothetical protein